MEHNLYILKASNLNGEQLIKFGYSSKLKERLEQYFSHNPFTEILYTFYKENAIDFEKNFINIIYLNLKMNGILMIF